jgi:2-oxoisovalerate dehydrogenase E1 component
MFPFRPTNFNFFQKKHDKIKIHETFTKQVGKFQDYAESVSSFVPLPKQSTQLENKTFKHLLNCQITTRLLDYAGTALFAHNKAYYDINNMGHEGMAAVANVFKLSDPKLLHYRSGAAYVEWLTRAGLDPITDVLRSITCSSHSFSGGRHKVFGNDYINVIPQTSTIASKIPKAVGLAKAITKANSLNFQGRFPKDSVVFCSFGDGSFNHGSAQDALNMVEWLKFKGIKLPIIMVCENNGVSISSINPPGYIEEVMSRRKGLHYIKANGFDIEDTLQKSMMAINLAREYGETAFLDVKTVRLGTHYLSSVDWQHAQGDTEEDPVILSIKTALAKGVLWEEIKFQLSETTEKILTIMDRVIKEPKIQISANIEQVNFFPKPTAKIAQSDLSSVKDINLATAINRSIKTLMSQYPKIIVFGDDVANKNGGPWGTTKDLEQLFGSERVFNFAIAETSILASAQMMGLNGLMPIIEIRHLAFLHNAIDQIRGEAATTGWLSNGQFHASFLLRIPGFGYNVNGGHFHNDSSIAALREIPGLIVACPSTPEVGLKMLPYCADLAFNKRKIVIFIEPIAQYKNSKSYESMRAESSEVNSIGIYGKSDLLTIISYGNGFHIAMQVVNEFKKQNIDIRVIDLQWLKPLQMSSICLAIKDTPNILIIDEGRKTGSISEELFTRISEEATENHSIYRVTAEDAFIPLGPAALAFFPQTKNILDYIKENIIFSANKNINMSFRS